MKEGSSDVFAKFHEDPILSPFLVPPYYLELKMILSFPFESIPDWGPSHLTQGSQQGKVPSLLNIAGYNFS